MVWSRQARPIDQSRGFQTSAVMAVLLTFVLLVPWRAAGSPPASSDESPGRKIQELVDKAVAARELAYKSIPRARGTGTYNVTVTMKDGIVRKERARFQMAFDHPKDFIQFRYEPGGGHVWGEGNLHARVVLSDGKHIYESVFSRKIHPYGVEGRRFGVVGKGSLAPVFTPSCGYLAKAWGFVHRIGEEGSVVSLRDDASLKVLEGKDPKGRFVLEFSIDATRDYHLVRFRLENDYVIHDVTRQWEKTGKLWYVKRYTEREQSKRGDEPYDYKTKETELVFETFEPNVPIPPEVFTVHALGLVDGARITDRRNREKPERYRYHPDPKFDVRKVEEVVGELPTALPPPPPFLR